MASFLLLPVSPLSVPVLLLSAGALPMALPIAAALGRVLTETEPLLVAREGRGKDRERDRERKTERERERERQTERERERQREKEKDRERKTERQRERKTEKERVFSTDSSTHLS